MQQPIRVLVTGANKGIGYGIIEYSLQNSPAGKYQFLLGSRDVQRGNQAREKLLALFPQASVEVVVLEVTSKESIDSLVKHLQVTGGVDALINNAAIQTDNEGFVGPKQLQETQLVNYHSPRALIERFLAEGLINQNGKVINISSLMGRFKPMFGHVDPFTEPALRNYATTLTLEELDAFVQKYEKEVLAPETAKSWNAEPWFFYSHSKNFLSVYSAVLSRDERIIKKGIQVYSACPGWCRTDLTAGQPAPQSYLEGAVTPFYLLELPRHIDPNLQGQFFSVSAKTPL